MGVDCGAGRVLMDALGGCLATWHSDQTFRELEPPADAAERRPLGIRPLRYRRSFTVSFDRPVLLSVTDLFLITILCAWESRQIFGTLRLASRSEAEQHMPA